MPLADTSEAEGSDLVTLKALNIVAEGDHEPADLTFLSVVEMQLELVLTADVVVGNDLFYFEAFAFPSDAFEEVAGVFLVKVLIECHLVAFDHLARRVGEAMDESAVVCDDEQALAFLVEAAGAKEALLAIRGRYEVVDRPLVMGVAVAAEKAFGLIQGENDGFLLNVANDIVIEHDFILPRGDFHPNFSGFSVHGHTPFFDESFCLAARGDALVREILL